MFKINKLYYSPVKSLSFSSVKKLEILDNIGIKFDRNFAFTRDLDDDKINYILNNPLKRQIINFLSLKHFPELNEYNFDFEKDILNLKKNNNIILQTNINIKSDVEILCNKILLLIPKSKRIKGMDTTSFWEKRPEELEYLTYLIIEGYKRYKKQGGFTECAMTNEWKEHQKTKSQPVHAFIKKRFEITKKKSDYI